MDRDVVVDAVPALTERLASVLEEAAPAAQDARGVFTIALSGGTTAAQVFPRLAQAPLDWARTEFFFADERIVPAAHPQSNYGLAASLWFWPAGVPAERVHRPSTDDPDRERAARRYAAELERASGAPPVLDFVLLGVGPDGHVASLFPGHAALDAAEPVAAVTDSPKPPPERFTLTLPVLTAARLVVIAAFGESKAAAIAAALHDGLSPLPVALVARRAPRVLFLLDPAAASRT